MFSFFKRKLIFKNPYSLPNTKKDFYGRNLIDLKIKLDALKENSENIFSTSFTKNKIRTHEYFVNFKGEFINNVEKELEYIFTTLETIEKKNKINKNDTSTIERNGRILSVTESVRRTLNYLTDS